MICSPQFVGGAEASQNGLRHGIPQNLVSSVGLGLDMSSLQPRGDANACALPIRNRIHNFTAAVGAISTGKEFGIRGLAGRTIDEYAASFKLHFRASISVLRKKTTVSALPNRQNN
jgi:hypothetical protein